MGCKVSFYGEPMNRDWYGFVVSFRSSWRSFNFLEDDENQVASDLFLYTTKRDWTGN